MSGKKRTGAAEWVCTINDSLPRVVEAMSQAEARRAYMVGLAKEGLYVRWEKIRVRLKPSNGSVGGFERPWEDENA